MTTDVEAILAFLLAGVLALLLVPLTERLRGPASARSTTRASASCTRRRRRSSAASAIFGGVLVAGLLFLPATAESHAILIGAVGDRLVGVLDDVYDSGAAEAARPDGGVIPVSAGVTVDNFTFPFFGRLTPGTVDLLTLPGGGVIHLGDVVTVIGDRRR